MKIKTYVARDMRQALRLVREEQGPDAVILSTRAVPDGVEVAAAVDMSEAHIVAEQGQFVEADIPPAVHRTVENADFAALLGRAAASASNAVELSRTVEQATRRTDVAARGELQVSYREPRPMEDKFPANVLPTTLTPAANPNNELVGAELRTLRHILEIQLAQLAWNDLTRRAPVQAELLKELTEIGLSQEIAADLVSQLPADLAFDEAQRRALALIARRIAVTGDAWLERGARLVFAGPTGVGKTTALAKLAARWVLRHGTRDVALICVDSARIGAQEHLKTVGRLLGVEAFAADDVSQLPDLISRLGERRLLLIDTAGAGPRDTELDTRIAVLNQAAEEARLEVCLVLAASAQAGSLEEAVTRFGALKPTSCLITKLDEATSLGGTISVLMRSQLPVSYVSEGQRIPEDLSPARAHQLVARAVQVARTAGALAGEDLLTRRFGGVAHVIA
ncbi:MAG: flagellar biosynthesis protein FlhF [Steroidobacteraceae bacterium]